MSYALFTKQLPRAGRDRRRPQAQEAYLAGNYFVTWCSWMGASLVGIALAT
jgi:predicted branched-subunit amino acid permease